MDRKIAIFIMIAAITATAFFSYPSIERWYIMSEIEEANYCNEDSDCVDAGSKCPFGCYAYVNKAEVERISELIDSYDSGCVYGCIACPTAVCENNKCVEVCE